MHSSNWVGRSGLHRESRATQADSLTVLKASKSEEGYVVFGVLLFACIALYVSVRIARNFKQFLNR